VLSELYKIKIATEIIARLQFINLF